MAVSRAARLAPVVEMAEKAERTAVQRLGHFQGQVRLAEAKLQELEQFRLNYQQQWIANGTNSARAWPGTKATSIMPVTLGRRPTLG
jgi:flagellar FliJ protein